MLTLRTAALCLLVVSGCKFPYPADVPDEGDPDAAIDGRTCTPNATTCTSGKLTACDATGALVSYTVPNGGPAGEPITVTLDDYSCPLGCDPGGTRCADVAPSNGLAAALDMASLSGLDLVIDDPTASAAAINTDLDPQNGSAFIIRSGGAQLPVPAMVVTQPAGPEILVLSVRSLTLTPGSRLALAGRRAFAIASHLDVFIAGHLDVTGGGVLAPGTPWSSACNAGATLFARGGGGNNDAGGESSTGGLGGASLGFSSAAALAPLVAGCSGGQVADTGGGGAIQIVSRTRVALGTTGMINVGGGPGRGRVENGQLQHLGGGGSGGAVLIEAPVINLTSGSRIAGRGGSGSAANMADGSFANGRSGSADLTVTTVPGATCAGCGTGGAGGTEIAPPGQGTGNGSALGAGGGSVGRCVLANASGLTISPPGTLLIRTRNGQVRIR